MNRTKGASMVKAENQEFTDALVMGNAVMGNGN